jgi:hypothetical protein
MHFCVSAARVGRPLWGDAGPGVHVRAALAEEDGHELVHARVREDARAIAAGVADVVAGHDGVLLLLEEIEEGGADFGGGGDLGHGKEGAEYGGRVDGRQE